MVMKTLKEIRSPASGSEVLEEGKLLRRGAGALYARQSKVHGDDASRHFSIANSHLTRSSDSLEEQLENIRKGLQETNKGLQKMRDQNGSITALCLISVLFSERSGGR